MLTITIPGKELFDDQTQTFIEETKSQTLQLEHSLISISKWESKWQRPFLKEDDEKTDEETIDYIRCMTITQNVDPNIYNNLSRSNIDDINKYIQSPMTATTFHNLKQNSGKKETPTSELIYYWMISYNIPMECQKWHINRLLTLIRVCDVKNTAPKKKSSKELTREYAAMNAARKKKYNTKG